MVLLRKRLSEEVTHGVAKRLQLRQDENHLGILRGNLTLADTPTTGFDHSDIVLIQGLPGLVIVLVKNLPSLVNSRGILHPTHGSSSSCVHFDVGQ